MCLMIWIIIGIFVLCIPIVRETEIEGYHGEKLVSNILFTIFLWPITLCVCIIKNFNDNDF